jgi:hypothetical protein
MLYSVGELMLEASMSVLDEDFSVAVAFATRIFWRSAYDPARLRKAVGLAIPEPGRYPSTLS